MSPLLLDFLICLEYLLLEKIVLLLNRAYFSLKIGILLFAHPAFFFGCCNFFLKVLDLFVGFLFELLKLLAQLLLLVLDFVS
mmetsp:Transcript_4438/g.5935  ORF Transcript_4438/g.5935 Transcript_4438/m.5935 type:complete len:82 (-) Transcript_4438:829-1074(-)